MTMVDLTDLFSWTFLMHFSRLLILFNIVHTTLKNKYNNFVTFIGIVGAGLLYSYFSLEYLNLVSNEVFLYVIFIFIEFFVVNFVCSGSLFGKIAAVIFGSMMYLLSNILATPILVLVGFKPEYFTAIKIPLPIVLCFSLFGYTLSFLVCFIIRFFQNRILQKNGKHTNKAYVLLLSPIIHLLSLLSFSSVMQFLYNESANLEIFKRFYRNSIIITIVCFVSDAFILFIVDYIDKLEFKNIENEKQILANTLTYQQTILLNEEQKEFRKLKHDINNLLTTAVGFMEIGHYDKALEILKETGVSFSAVGGNAVCSNDLINTIIFIKSKTSKEKNIELIFSVNENSVIHINNYDLCRLLNNLVDNSINAVEQAQDSKTAKIDILIDNEHIIISTRNAYSRKSNHNKHDINHGYGIRIIKEIIKKYNGTYNTKTNDDIYITETILDNISQQTNHPL